MQLLYQRARRFGRPACRLQMELLPDALDDSFICLAKGTPIVIERSQVGLNERAAFQAITESVNLRLAKVCRQSPRALDCWAWNSSGEHSSGAPGYQYR